MSLTKHIDKLIAEAIERGEFENLKGEGKPIDLDAYFATAEDVRVGQAVLKSNEFVPEEVDRLREIGDLRVKLSECADEGERSKLQKLLRERDRPKRCLVATVAG